jgi:hypothetical protein
MSPEARLSRATRWRRRKALRRATPSSKPSAAGAWEVEAWRRWWRGRAGELEAEEVVRRWEESAAERSWKRDLRREECGFGGSDGEGEGGSEAAEASERDGEEMMDARCRISSPMPPGCRCLHARRRRSARLAPWAAKLYNWLDIGPVIQRYWATNNNVLSAC